MSEQTGGRPRRILRRATARWVIREDDRLGRVLERNAQWVAEARHTLPLYLTSSS